MEAGRTRLSRQRFHLDLREDGTYTSSWQKETLACKGNSVWKAEIKFKDGSGNNEITLTVSTGQPSSTKEQSLCWECPQMLSNIDQERRPKLSASLLKSAVQKNVRLCRSSPAVRASLHLMKDSWSEFLRRATIIALEDAILHPDLPFLVWLTAAVAKGYQPSKLHAAVCLRIVHEMAAVKCRDPLSDADEADTHCPTMSDISQHVSAQEATVLKALLLRASCGGMAGDVRMLRCYVRVWLKRFSGASPPPPPLANFCSGPADVTSPSSDVSLDWGNWLRRLYAQTPRPPQVLDTCTSGALPAVVDVAAMSRIMLSDVPPSAADFHCSNVIEDVLKDTPAGRQVEATCREEAVDAKAVFRSAMWHFRSSKNLKKTLDGETSTDTEDGSQAARIWSALSAEAQKYSLNLIKRRFGVWT
ncbi:hypothetical protein KFL_000560270 [Klebsormidium nitens]|uniref:Uncharacterized protein n=1 Tax=Klebsormidium nitens TaxID=105231 RepID=A0A1Y1HXF2_KLENI|nr:hypothetical protein KFL_000560270 [Klebsormidium nitens]|eukprot:GAQ80538.1 hypothetical protein KFL_000560270 [Klebsormidium nitens]